ncbi:uncharacterized protein HMPREF1541_07175 [Cyphellophora europaea CBS 101466]|uniref:Uncharacterized protein n=1 Tax=Cyphellophora europaea (strain CBS 101466) TaxID=1220924 RepID=W2RPC8_CYPE1|nr:uncharacterized protein HMPREF1541_07175 [Cyphellophora europaea CBS 101466]ETN37553.1 hypothetical protein HMPREF1541_07175 [Cyphellophora europaea CBS 101466]
MNAINNTFLAGPRRCIDKPGVPPASGLHFDHSNGPFLEQFPAVILSQILLELEPIWLFQIERAIPSIALFLTHKEANLIWYGVLPPALFCTPEAFQNEKQTELAKRYFYDRGDNKTRIVDVTIGPIERRQKNVVSIGVLPNNRIGDSTSLRRMGIQWLDNCSSTANETNTIQSFDHLHRSSSFPLIKSSDPDRGSKYRVRNLALGGPYEHYLSYRREILGHFHAGVRCDICLEMLRSSDRKTKIIGLLLCQGCLGKWTIDPNKEQGRVIEYVKDVLPHIASPRTGFNRSVHAPNGQIPLFIWLPVADYIVRDRLGVDYLTAKAKAKYFDQIKQLKNKDSNLAVLRRKLRHQIVAAAEKILKECKADGMGQALNLELLKYWSQSFLPWSRVGEVLYPPKALDRIALLMPHECTDVYPRDQTLTIESSAAAKRFAQDATSIESAARAMLQELVSSPNSMTRLVEIATQYHTARLLPTFHPEGLKNGVRSIVSKKRFESPFVYSRRLKVIFAKLHTHPDPRTQAVALVPKGGGKERVLKLLPRIVEGACLVCPYSGTLAPRGLAGVIEHVRVLHPDLFWGRKHIGSQEARFYIIG